MIQVLTLKLFFLVIHIFVYFYLIQAHLHSSILNLLSILTISKLLVISIVLSIFLLFQVCVYYVAICNSFTLVYVLQNQVQNVGLISRFDKYPADRIYQYLLKTLIICLGSVTPVVQANH